MPNLALMGAPALLLALTVAGANAQPTTDPLMNAGFGATLPSSNATATNLTIHEGRAAALVPFANAGFYQPAHKGR